MLLVSLSAKFQSASLDPTVLELQATWRQVHEWPQMILNTSRSKAFHICLTSAPESQTNPTRSTAPHICINNWYPLVSNLTPFHHQPFFDLQDILRIVHQMTPTWPWTLQGQKYSICVLLVLPSPNFHSVLLYDVVKLQVILRPVRQMTPNDEPYKVKCTADM